MTAAAQVLPKPVSPLDGLAVSAAVFALSCAVLWIALNRGAGLYDEGIMLVGGWLVGQGQVPYRDFYYVYGPAPLYLIAGAFKLLGPSVAAARTVDIVIKSVLVVLIRRLGMIAAGRAAGWPVTALVLVWMGGIAKYNYPVWLSATLGAGAVLLLLRDTRRAELGAGLLTGLSILARYDMALATLAALGGVLLWKKAAAEGRFAPAAIAAACVPFAGGFLLAALPIAAVAASLGAVDDIGLQMGTLPLAFYQGYRRLEWPGGEINEDIVLYFPLAAVVLAVATRATRAGGSEEGGRALWAVRFLCALAAAFVLKAIVRKSAIHVVPALMVALPVAAAAAARVRANWHAEGRAVKSFAALTALLLAVPTVVTAVDAVSKSALLPAVQQRVPALLGEAPRETAIGSGLVPADLAAAIGVLVSRTAPDETVLIGTNRHDRVFVNDVTAYFLARRMPATKWYTYDAGVHASAPVQQEMIADLERSRPRFALLSSAYDAVREPNLSAVSTGVVMLDDYLAAHYRPVAVFGAYAVVERIAAR